MQSGSKHISRQQLAVDCTNRMRRANGAGGRPSGLKWTDCRAVKTGVSESVSAAGWADQQAERRRICLMDALTREKTTLNIQSKHNSRPTGTTQPARGAHREKRDTGQVGVVAWSTHMDDYSTVRYGYGMVPSSEVLWCAMQCCATWCEVRLEAAEGVNVHLAQREQARRGRRKQRN